VSDDAPTGGRRPYRPPVGIPDSDERRKWRSVLTSIAIHIGILILLILPPVAAALLVIDPRSAGLFGPRGGGGGGRGIPERLHFMQVAPPAAAPTPAPVKPPPTPPPRVVPQRVPPPTPVAPPAALAPAPSADTTRVASTGGTAGGPGAGPGTGGGVGDGSGTGIGNGKGPGTGGDGASKIKATAKLVTAYAVDPPKRPRPFHLVAVFEVAANGVARLLTVNKADDGDFNKKMHEHLLETEFKPATLANGTPVVDTVVVTADY
jgi:hypothetical protein